MMKRTSPTTIALVLLTVCIFGITGTAVAQSQKADDASDHWR